MKTFRVYEDQKVTVWRRTYYTVEAETLEEVIELINNGDADSNESETLYETETYLDPCESYGSATHEIYNQDNDKLIWDNTME